MTPDPAAAPPTPPDPLTAARMRAALAAAGFAGSLPLQRADVREHELGGYHPAGKKLAVALRRTAAGEPVDVLTRLFLMGLPVPAADANRALAGTGMGVWVRSGLLTRDGEMVRAAVALAPVRGLYLAFDPTRGGPPGPRHVMGYSLSTDTLARATVRRRARRVLDLGTGCGVLALLAAAHAGEVVATDTNPRCLALTRFNAALNGLGNVTTREGDLFAPAAGERFDLIVSNPPFVISPEREFEYRDAGRPGDTLLRELLAAGPDHLAPGGYFQFTAAWAVRPGEDAHGRIAGWLAGSGCDAWVLTLQTFTPADWAEHWASALPGDAPADWAARMTRWTDWYAAEGITGLCVGLFTLRKRAGGGRPWLQFDDAPRFAGDVGGAVERGFAGLDFLAALPGPDLLASRVRVADGVLWEQQMTPAAAGWRVSDAQVRVKDGLCFMTAPDETVMGLLDRCRGEPTLARVFDAAAGGDRDGGLEVVRRLVRQGFLIPADPPTA